MHILAAVTEKELSYTEEREVGTIRLPLTYDLKLQSCVPATGFNGEVMYSVLNRLEQWLYGNSVACESVIQISYTWLLLNFGDNGDLNQRPPIFGFQYLYTSAQNVSSPDKREKYQLGT